MQDQVRAQDDKGRNEIEGNDGGYRTAGLDEPAQNVVGKPGAADEEEQYE